MRSELIRWFEAQHLYPRIVGEFDDSALLKAFGQAGAGLFVAPTAIADYASRQYTVQAVGRIDSVTEQLHAIITERRLSHPAIVAVVQPRSASFSVNQSGPRLIIVVDSARPARQAAGVELRVLHARIAE